jgi:glycolate oxidase FAD binding subunit
LPTKLAALVAGFAALDAMPGMSAHAVGDPVGVVTAALTGPATSLAEVVHDLRARLHPLGGTVVVLHRGALPVEIDAWNDAEHPPAALEVMRAIKQEFDPLRLLSPGRFVGGL